MDEARWSLAFAASPRVRLRPCLRWCREYGVAIQRSAFEAGLTPAAREHLLERVKTLVDAATDRFVMYGVPSDQEIRIAALGLPRPEVASPSYYLL